MRRRRRGWRSWVAGSGWGRCAANGCGASTSNGRKAGKEKGFLVGEYGRMRTVATAPDGNLWVTTSNHDGRGDPAAEDDRILLVRP